MYSVLYSNSVFFSGEILILLLKNSITSLRFSTPITSIPSTRAPSFAFSLGRIILLIPFLFASKQIGKIPLTLFICPSKDSSPITTVLSSIIFITPMFNKMATAIGKS